MAETTQFVSRISVKDLISAFENRSETVKVEFSRPRARSYGNVLNKNVVVRLNEFLTLGDIEKALTKLQSDLNFYEVYNKAKHVAFQEQSFNILTSIVNIENDEENSPSRKKNLISRTQNLVSFLNQKLPTNLNQVIGSNVTNKYKYVPYSSHVKSSTKVEVSPDPVESKFNKEADAKPTLFVESSGAIDITQSGEEYFVSVKKLKENFQQKSEVQTNSITKVEENTKNTDKVSTTVKKVKNVEPMVVKQERDTIVEERTKLEEKVEAVSVTKLRSLFEKGSVENSRGLEIITVEKPQLIHNPLGRSVQNINVPYTDWNLGTYRLQRSVSGNYMNYSGLLNRVDITRSSSVLELSKSNDDAAAFEGISDEDSSTESDDTVELRTNTDKVEEVEDNYLSDDQKPAPEKYEVSENDQVSIVSNSEEAQVKGSSITVTENEKNHITIQENVPNGTATFLSETQPHENKTDLEEVSNLQGFEEEEVNFSKASTEDINLDEDTTTEQELTFQGVDEVEVNTAIASGKNVEAEERVATLLAAEEEIPEFTSTLEAFEIGPLNDKATENEITFKGVDEIEVNSGTAESKNIQVEERVAKLEVSAEDDTLQSMLNSGIGKQNIEHTNDFDNSPFSSLEGTENHVTESRNYAISSQFNSLDLEDERDRSLIQEVIENIDVEKTLANADLVVNPEDLKNADDEFEKLIETSETKK